MKLVWSERALGQLAHAVETIAKENPAAAWRIYDRIHEAAERLAQFPLMGKEGRVPDTRELVITGTTYTAVYRIIGERIEIAAVWHWAQSRKRR